MITTRRRVAAVIGATSPSPRLLAAAEVVGAGLARAGLRVATGGLEGVMEAAARGARAAAAFEGCTIGILPGLAAGEANEHIEIVIPTGLNFARNVVLTALADVVVAIGGGAGTLSEIAMAWQHKKPIVALDLAEGWSTELAGRALDGRRADSVRRATSADEAVRLAVTLANDAVSIHGF